MNISSAELAIAYRACINEALRQSPLLIERWSSALSDLLQSKASSASIQTEKNLLRQAVVALKIHQQDLAKRFELELTQATAQNENSRSVKSPAVGRSLSTVSFDDLELMGDNQVQETLEDARLQQALAQTSEFELAGFSARLSTSQGFHKVEADKNPLRPEVLAGALLKAVRNSPIDKVSQSRLLVHGALLMGKELQDLYITLDILLAGRGVKPAAYGVVTASSANSLEGLGPRSSGELNRPTDATDRPSTASTANRPALAAKIAVPAGQGVSSGSSEQLLTLDRLHRLMVGEYNDSFIPAQDPRSAVDDSDVPRNEFSHTVPAAMHMLDELKQQGLTLNPQKKERAAPLPPVALIREHLKTEAKTLGQSVAIEVVGLMIEQLTNDYRLLLPVKQIIANAEPAFLRLAVTDPRFFNDKNHPARRLLDVITTKSLAYASEDADGFAGFMLDLNKVAELLTEAHASDAQHFATLLQDFEQRQLHRSRLADEARARGIEALIQAEDRNVLAGKIAAEIRTRPDFRAGNPAVEGFLMGPWSQVMAKEWLDGRARDKNISGSRFSLALKDILRSANAVNAADALGHRQWLNHALPRLLETLRAGLQSIDYPLDSAKDFFDHLVYVHRSALTIFPVEGSKPPTFESADGSVAKTRGEALEKVFKTGDAVDNYLWLAPSEAAQSGFMDFGAASALGSGLDFDSTQTQAGDAAKPGGSVDSPEPFGAGTTVVATEAIQLKVGDWVELLSDMRWLRAQLTFISPQHTLFMFTSEGGRSHSMTSRVLSHLLMLNLVKVVNQHNVLDGALDGVAATAIRNSVDSPSLGSSDH